MNKVEDERAAADIAFRVHGQELYEAFTRAQQATYRLDRIAVGVSPEVEQAKKQLDTARTALLQAHEELSRFYKRMGWR